MIKVLYFAGLREALGTAAEEVSPPLDLLDVGADKVEGVIGSFPGWHSSVWTEEYQIALDQQQASDLIAMGPNAFHGSPSDVTDTTCTTSVSIITLTHP